MGMRKQKGIYVPEQDTAKIWGLNWEVREYNRINPKGNRAIDIGAHVGIWTRRLAVDFNEVIAFEPMKKHIECHKKNCEEFDNITLKEVAVSNENCFQVMTTKDINSGMSTLLDQNDLRWKKEQLHEIVETRTLDSYNFPKIDFIKIDVEEWEEQALEGAMQTILKYKPIMYIEIHKQRFNKIKNLLQEIEYDLQKNSYINYLCVPIK